MEVFRLSIIFRDAQKSVKHYLVESLEAHAAGHLTLVFPSGGSEDIRISDMFSFRVHPSTGDTPRGTDISALDSYDAG